MVFDKKRSGDPDYDDKVPMHDQAAQVVTAGDGQPVLMTKSNGPVSPSGQHVNLDDIKGDAKDNRPVPGQVATEASEVQTYDVTDTPTADDSLGQANSLAEANALVDSSSQDAKDQRAQAGATNKDAKVAAPAKVTKDTSGK